VKAAQSRRVGRIPDLSNLQTLADLLETRTKRRNDLEQLLNESHRKNDDVEDTREDFEKAHKELESKTEGICPLCGKEIDE